MLNTHYDGPYRQPRMCTPYTNIFVLVDTLFWTEAVQTRGHLHKIQPLNTFGTISVFHFGSVRQR